MTPGAFWYSTRIRLEALGVALRALLDLGPVAVRFLEQPRRVAARARHDVVRVGLALVLQSLAILACLDGVVERGLHLVGRLHVLQRDLLHEHAGAVAVEVLLHQLLGLLGDLLAAFVQREVHLALADHFADRRLGDIRDDLVGTPVVEDVVLGALQVVLDGELDVDDVLVIGQHHRFLVDLVLRRVAIADLDRLHLRELDELDGFDGKGQVPAGSGLRRLGVLAEARHDTAATFVDDVEAAGEPDDEDQRDEHAGAAERQPRAWPTAVAAILRVALATEDFVHPAVDVAPDLVEVGWAAALIAAALAPLRVIQRHEGATRSSRMGRKRVGEGAGRAPGP